MFTRTLQNLIRCAPFAGDRDHRLWQNLTSACDLQTTTHWPVRSESFGVGNSIYSDLHRVCSTAKSEADAAQLCRALLCEADSRNIPSPFVPSNATAPTKPLACAQAGQSTAIDTPECTPDLLLQHQNTHSDKLTVDHCDRVPRGPEIHFLNQLPSTCYYLSSSSLLILSPLGNLLLDSSVLR
jgi:hypothetical protein